MRTTMRFNENVNHLFNRRRESKENFRFCKLMINLGNSRKNNKNNRKR